MCRFVCALQECYVLKSIYLNTFINLFLSYVITVSLICVTLCRQLIIAFQHNLSEFILNLCSKVCLNGGQVWLRTDFSA